MNYKIKECINSIEILKNQHTLYLVTVNTKVTFLENSQNYNAETSKKHYKNHNRTILY